MTYFWGRTKNAELTLHGIEEEDVEYPRKLEFTEELRQVACGGQHTVLLTQNGKIFSYGNNDFGQLGTSELSSRKRPQMITTLENYDISQISCGTNHSLAINQWGQIFSWGSNSQGQLGLDNSSSANHSIPKLIKTLATMHIVQIACGRLHSLALTNTGELYSFGANTQGELGLGTTSDKVSKPTLISSLAGIPIAFIACGGSHSFVVSKSGAVFGFGNNCNGQLGVGDTKNRVYPIQLKTMRSIGVRYISCGDDFSVFLTQDGGVFSCGNNQYGQLGHGSTINEALPKKVVELMGSNCTQIACGKSYYLVLIPSRGRIYGCGQLSHKGNVTSATPTVIEGPWTPNESRNYGSADNLDIDESMTEKMMIKKIFAGGERCFVSLVEEFKAETPDDFREYSTNSQIAYLTVALSKLCSDVERAATLDFELISSIEVIFKSLACVNASFLLENNKHFCCTSKHNGVDLESAAIAFDHISKIENDNLKHLIWDSITNELLSTLVTRPADVECLRVYLVLPLYHEFINSKNYQKLQTPFATAIMSVDEIPLKIIKQWYANAPIDFFERMVQVYLDVVKYFFQIELRKVRNASKQVMNEPNLVMALSILSMFYLINHMDRLDGQRVPYEAFHIPDISENFEIRQDYVHWCIDNNSAKLYLCNYPFLFDASAKMLLLQTDQALQMHSAMQSAANQSVISVLTGIPANIYIMLVVSRDNVVEDTIRELANYGCHDLKKPLKVKFENEEGEDAGGVRKEFFMLLLREVLDPKYGMFKYYEDSRSIWFSESSFEGEEMFKLIGILCGLAIYNFTIINLSFPLALYKKLLNEKVDINDLKELSPQQAISLQAILDYKEPDLEEVFCINFEVTREFFGETRTIPLKPNGDKIGVTQENKKEFVDLYIDYIFNKSVEKHFKGFHAGFNRVCDGRVMKLFRPHELMAVVIGNEEYDWDVFEEVAEYKDYSTADQVIQWFWEVFRELSLAEKKMFLLFLTGSDRIPITGMKALKICIQPTENTLHLPVAHTCVSLLDLPRYTTKERLKYKLVQAIQQTTGFSLV